MSFSKKIMRLIQQEKVVQVAHGFEHEMLIAARDDVDAVILRLNMKVAALEQKVAELEER